MRSARGGAHPAVVRNYSVTMPERPIRTPEAQGFVGKGVQGRAGGHWRRAAPAVRDALEAGPVGPVSRHLELALGGHLGVRRCVLVALHFRAGHRHASGEQQSHHHCQRRYRFARRPPRALCADPPSMGLLWLGRLGGRRPAPGPSHRRAVEHRHRRRDTLVCADPSAAMSPEARTEPPRVRVPPCQAPIPTWRRILQGNMMTAAMGRRPARRRVPPAGAGGGRRGRATGRKRSSSPRRRRVGRRGRRPA